MYSRRDSTVIGVFSCWSDAEAAFDHLFRAGFEENEVGIVARDPGDEAGMPLDHESTDPTAGAVTGAVTGATLGSLIGIGILAGVIPVVGPALFAGTLGVLASNVAGGAMFAGLIGALTSWGVSEDDARAYEEEIVNGGALVTVSSVNRTQEARSIMTLYGGYTRRPLERCSITV